MISEGPLSLAERARLQPVLKRFPQERATLLRLFRESSSFQSLCDDYWDCLTALRHWEQSASGEAPALAKAYVELLRELEEEVRQFLEDAQAYRVGSP